MTKRALIKRRRELVEEEKSAPKDVSRLRLVDDYLSTVATAWPYVKKWDKSHVTKSDTIWDFIGYDEEEWAILAGVARDSNFKKATQRLKSLRLITPEGEIAPDMSALIQQDIKKRLGLDKQSPKKSKISLKKSEEKSKST